ncbi:MAG: thymidylate synthase [Elusimicrobiota bacterium]
MVTDVKQTGNIPVFMVEGANLPEAWEKAVLKVWSQGESVRTEYDKPGDPPSKDCTMMMVVNDPYAEPRIHKAFPGGLDDLEVYRQEVVNGVHDHWIKPEEGKWTYTYHQRLFAYEIEGKVVNQIDYVVNRLSKAGHSRRAQAITWNVKTDAPTEDPPCLQRIWFRMSPDDKGGMVLNMNTHWRSRDAFKAAFMNIFALTDLFKIVAERISKNIGKPVKVGRYVDIADSFHIYGSYFKELDRFMDTIKNRSWEDRTWNSEFAEPFFEDGKKRLENEKTGK